MRQDHRVMRKSPKQNVEHDVSAYIHVNRHRVLSDHRQPNLVLRGDHKCTNEWLEQRLVTVIDKVEKVSNFASDNKATCALIDYDTCFNTMAGADLIVTITEEEDELHYLARAYDLNRVDHRTFRDVYVTNLRKTPGGSELLALIRRQDDDFTIGMEHANHESDETSRASRRKRSEHRTVGAGKREISDTEGAD